MRDSADRKYSKEWLQYERQQPMYDNSINEFYQDVFKYDKTFDIETLDEEFKSTFIEWLHNHSYSNFKGIEKFPVRHIMQGCTHFIDDLYQKTNIQIFENDYKYHWRLNNDIKYATIDTLDTNFELLISMPFPYYGDVHPNMYDILDECAKRKISVHVDSAWISCIRDIEFNFDHPAIKTFGISLSKAGIGGNRIGLRFAREMPSGSITIMNDFKMNQQALMYIGIKFMKTFGPEYFWKKYEEKYYKICKDFNLTPTKTIHLARDGKRPVGIRPLLRSL